LQQSKCLAIFEWHHNFLVPSLKEIHSIETCFIEFGDNLICDSSILSVACDECKGV
jgi:hypothetical protein